MPILAQEILKQFDEAAAGFVFPMLDNGYVYHADARISIYRDADDWLMIFESLGAYTPRVSGCDSFQNFLYIFGNAPGQAPGTSNEDVLFPIAALPDDPLFADEYDWHLRPGAGAVEIRGRRVFIDVSGPALAARGIELVEPPQIDPAAVLRSLLPEWRSLLLATEEELELRNPKQLPLWLRLDEWCHPDLAGDEKPSENETFRMLAEAIATGDSGRYQPTLPPNTHWRNWPDGGTL